MHTGDVYRFIPLETQHVILSRDARWMNIMWKAYMRKQKYINHGLQMIDEYNRNMSKSKGWTLQSSLLMLWMDENSNQQSN